MYQHSLHNRINLICDQEDLILNGPNKIFYTRLIANTAAIRDLYIGIYGNHAQAEKAFDALIHTIIKAYKERSVVLKEVDTQKEQKEYWYLSNELTGMSLYVDRFCGSLSAMEEKLDYFNKLGVNLLHLMPLFQSPPNESDGGYAVSDFRVVNNKFGSLQDLQQLRKKMKERDIYLMIDIVLNHTSHKHEWAEKAKQGEKEFQDYFYMYDDRIIPDQFDQQMPDIFPESSPGNFTYIEECKKWVMTVFHHYQWDLNYTNPAVFNAMLETIFFYANLGVDILRIDAPAFIWKQMGTSCQNLPQAHELLRLIKQCVQVAVPCMALLGEAIVAPKEIMKYFGTDLYTGRECDFTYNATQMALQWDALATGDTRIMLAAQQDLLQKPYGCSWITYTRCHDDIGLGYDDSMIASAGFNAYEHRSYLKDFYAGIHAYSTASGALFSVNPKTQDARISGSLASLCGLEKALANNDTAATDIAIRKIILMQAQSFFIGGLPMLFYGDEAGYTNDYSYLQDPAKSYDNRWMHRPVIDWKKNARTELTDSIEERIYSATKKLISLRNKLTVLSDRKNIRWLSQHNIHIAGFLRSEGEDQLYCLFNYSPKAAYITWYTFKENGPSPVKLYDHWADKRYTVGADNEYLVIAPYSFCLLKVAD